MSLLCMGQTMINYSFRSFRPLFQLLYDNGTTILMLSAFVSLIAINITLDISLQQINDSARYIGDIAAGALIASTLVFVASVSLLKLIIDKHQSTEEQFEQKKNISQCLRTTQKQDKNLLNCIARRRVLR